MTDVFLLAAEEGGSEGGLEFLLPAPSELVMGILAFLIVFLVMWRFAVPGMRQLMDERQAAISGQIEAAEAARTEADRLRSEYEQQLAGAKAEANGVIEEARSSAESVRADIVAKAEDEAARIRERAQADAEAEKARVLAEARQEVAGLSVSLAEKVVGGSLDDERQRELVEQYLTQLESE
jgi:F-type H+-transporting ATPase subunit b